MRLLRRLGFESTAWALRRLHCPVADDALVLEVGSGGNPYPRADVLLDAYEVTRERHWVPLKADRPTVLGFVERLPFRDGAFDFVIASHVLEHSADPVRFLSELQRVARAGYIETPDAFMERVNPYRDHRLEVTVRDGRLLIRKKRAWRVDEELVELYEHQAKRPIAGGLIPRDPFAFHVRFYWKGTIPHEVVNPGVDAGWAAPEEATHARPGTPDPRTRVREALTGWLARRREVDLLPLLRCPACLAGSLAADGDKLRCMGCAAEHPVRNGIPVLYPPEEPRA
jgi:SAM-dependent methyltransferase